MEHLVRAQGWTGEWHPASEGTVLVALLGQAQVLKLFPPFLADHAHFEQGLLQRLQGQLSLPTPTLLAQGEQDAWRWTRMTQLPGQLLLTRWPYMTEIQRLTLLQRLGELAREVHALPLRPGGEVQVFPLALLLLELRAEARRHLGADEGGQPLAQGADVFRIFKGR